MTEQEQKRIAFIGASWHADIVDSARKGFHEEMLTGGFSEDLIDYFKVPGSLELPYKAKQLALTEKYQAIIACGFIVDGGIYRHEFVAQAVVDGIVNVSLETMVPVFSVALAPQKFDEKSAEDNDFFIAHMLTKGEEAARSCLEIIA